jgi:hypothetical protein
MSVFLANLELICFAVIMFLWGLCVGRMVSAGWVCLHVNAEKMKIHSYIHVGKNPCPKDVP